MKMSSRGNRYTTYDVPANAITSPEVIDILVACNIIRPGDYVLITNLDDVAIHDEWAKPLDNKWVRLIEVDNYGRDTYMLEDRWLIGRKQIIGWYRETVEG